MSTEIKKEIELEIAHVLFIDIVGYSKLPEDCINRLVQRRGVPFPAEVRLAARGARFDIVGHDGEPTGQDRVQGDAAPISIRMDSTVLTTSLHGLRGMGLILNLRYPRNLRLCAPNASEMLSYGALKLHPVWDPLRGDPRFEKIVASLAPASPR